MPEHDQNLAELGDALQADLRDATGREGLRIAGTPRRLTGGFDTDTYAFDIEAAPEAEREKLVLRHYREAAGSDRPLFESTVQNAAARSGQPVPEAPYDTTGRSLIGRAYMVMRLMPGMSLLEILMADPMGKAEMASTLLGTTQARIHDLDPGGLTRALNAANIDTHRSDCTTIFHASRPLLGTA
ncbi:MAG: phosphotransferase [Chloroflexi bacterium]|nr:phosphotransferase [Chloroflexota bacterium]